MNANEILVKKLKKKRKWKATKSRKICILYIYVYMCVKRVINKVKKKKQEHKLQIQFISSLSTNIFEKQSCNDEY
jgi:hypothetical protein